MDKYREGILEIIDRLGMGTRKASEIMRMSDNTFRKKKMGTLKSYKFTQINYNDLVDFLINELKFLMSLSQSQVANEQLNVIEKINNILENASECAKKEGWNVFDELKLVVDYMETSDTFKNMEMYYKIIEYLSTKSNDEFSVEKYNEYVSKVKKSSYDRWREYIRFVRSKTIYDILNN